MGHGEVDGLEVPKVNEEEKLSLTIHLNIGIFFDGTNNNKYQVMLGKAFRRKEIFENAKKRIKEKIEESSVTKINDIFELPKYSKRSNWEENGSDSGVLTVAELNFIYGVEVKDEPLHIVRTVNDVLNISRSDIEKYYDGVFTKTELEHLYFGYGTINDTKDKSYDIFIEKKSAQALEGKSQNELSARPDNKKDRELLHNTAEHFAEHHENKEAEKFKGAPAQNATYTNVAILESLYKCENDGKNTERHISIYVEGSGADMQFTASTSTGYKATVGLAGLGLGTGPTGVVSKIRKASSIVQRLIDQYKCMSNVKVMYHFDLFGFSRGATCARVMAYLINPDPNTDKAYTGENKINNNDYLLLTSRENEFLPIDDKTKKEIRFMGLFDTVSSIGVKDEEKAISILTDLLENTINKEKESNKTDIPTLWKSIKPTILPACKILGSFINIKVGYLVGEFIGKYFTYNADEKITPIIMEAEQYAQSNDYRDKGTEDISVLRPEGKSFFHKDNVKDYGLWATNLAKNVVHVCAMDEVRQNFALVDIESSLREGKEKSIEVFIPGCHTDIGGGAAIGMEGEQIINKDSEKYLTSYYVHSKSWLEKDNGDLLKPINVKSLKEIGWLNPDSKTPGFFTFSVTGRVDLDVDETYYCDNTIPANVIMYRHVTPGYSNVALNFMKEKAIGDPFKEIPKAYEVPKDLDDLYRQLQKINSSGRYFVYPNELGQYSELRRRFIHFSFNEQWLDVADNALVNGPEYAIIDNIDKGYIKVISRIIYPGDLDAKPMHMFDYEDGHPAQNIKEDEPPQSGLHPALSGDYTGFEEYDSSFDSLVFNPA